MQIQMFVLELLSCDFVVWTTKGIFSVEVPYGKMFLTSLLKTLEKFWLLQVVPLLRKNVGLKITLLQATFRNSLDAENW